MFNFARPEPNVAVIRNPSARDFASRDGGEAIVGAAHRACFKWFAGVVGKKPCPIGPPHPLASAAAVLEVQDFPAELWDDRNLDPAASQADQLEAVDRGLEND